MGNYATNQLAPALQKTNHCRLSAIVTGTPFKEEVWMERYNIPRNISNVSQQARQMDDFAKCVKNDREILVPGEMGWRDMLIMEAIYEAADTGRSVSLNQLQGLELPRYEMHQKVNEQINVR